MMLSPGIQDLVHALLKEYAGMAIRGAVSDAVSREYTQQIFTLVNCLVMNRNETAQFLGVSVRTLDRFVKDDGLRHECRQLQPGKRAQKVFLLDDVLDWQHNRFIALLPEEDDIE